MKMVKSLILGSAAGLIAMSGAQAADLPVKAKAVEYVKICSLYGAGFWYVPGTDTCIKLGGYLRVDTTLNGGVYDRPAWSGNDGQGNRLADSYQSRSRMAFTIDTRTATEYGVVRTFGQADIQYTSPDGTVASSGYPTGSGVGVEQVFIQFAGFTFGKSQSAYSTPWHGYPGNNTSYLMGGHDSVTGVNNIQYTAQFGNGVSGSIGLDDSSVYNRTSVYNLSTGLSAAGTTGNAYGGNEYPDIVANVRIDQAWGLFQLSGALHRVNASYNTLTAGTAAANSLSEISGHPDSKWGGSVMAALLIRNLPTGRGDDFKIDATYAKGDTKNVISTSASSPSFAMFSGSSRDGAYQSVGFGATTDAVYLPGSTDGLKLTTAYGIRGAFNHNWDPNWSTSLFGSYSAVRYDGSVGDLSSAKGAYCATYAASNAGAKSADYSCNPDYNVAQLGVVTRWTPVKNLTFSAEAQWFHLDQMFTGTSVLGAASPKPTTVYEYKDQDTYSLNLRVQRNF
ncbi:MAG: porin [Pseudomonadota bacterium]